jgi:hypothetical protein
LIDSGSDLKQWNDAIEELELTIGEENCTWFKAPWLFTECYVYRRIREAMLLCTSEMKNYDPYENAKLETHETNVNSVFQLITSLCPLDFENEKTNADLLKRRYVTIVEVRIEKEINFYIHRN